MKTNLERLLDAADREIAICAAHMSGSVEGLLKVIECGEQDLAIHHAHLRQSLARYDEAFARRKALLDGLDNAQKEAAS